MGFGFGATDEDEEDKKDDKPKFEYMQRDRVTRHSWGELEIGTRVRSILTGTFGTITKKADEWKMITTDWDNGNTSEYSHKYYYEVVVIKAT